MRITFGLTCAVLSALATQTDAVRLDASANTEEKSTDLSQAESEPEPQTNDLAETEADVDSEADADSEADIDETDL